MRKMAVLFLSILLLAQSSASDAQEGLIPAFPLEPSELELDRLAQPATPFNKVGRKFAVLGFESGSFEAWAYPLKLLRNFEFSFFLGSSTRPILGKDIVRYISVTPEATVLTYTYQSFTIRAIYITPIDESGAIILLQVGATEPLSIVCGFLPVLQPMWPAGIGGQYAYWSDKQRAYILGESTGMNHGLIGSPAASGLSYTPAHMLSDFPSEFKVEIKDPASVRGKYIPIILAGGKGKRDAVIEVYDRLKKSPEEYYRKTAEHYRRVSSSTLQVKTPSVEMNLAFEWAKVALDNLLVDNPDLGKGLVAGLGASGTSGRPGFGWFFGTDAYLNSLSLNSYGAYSTSREVLSFTQKWQRQDGKMAHELSQAAGYIDWFGKYHYGYIHGDTSPYYIASMYDYYKTSGDLEFIKASWESIKKAYEWSLAADANGDGLMDNKKAGLGALEFGALTGIETDIYLAAVWLRAAYAMQYLAEAAGQKSWAQKARQHLEKAKQAFDEKFWDEASQQYAYAFNANGERVTEVSPWSAVALMWDLGEAQRSTLTLQKLCSAELMTDWGIRSMSNQSKYYEPLNYNYGAVWPFLTGYATAALFKHHFLLQGYNSLLATARHSFDNNLGYFTEVFSGSANVWPQEAVSAQGFSSTGFVLPFVRGLLGLEGDAAKKSITFAPHFPADWDSVEIKNYQIGPAKIDFDYVRQNDKLTIQIDARGADGFNFRIAPAFAIGAQIQEASVDEKPAHFELLTSQQVVQPVLTVKAREGVVTLAVSFDASVEVLPPRIESKTGDADKGLKIVALKKADRQLIVEVQGFAEEQYELRVTHPEKIAGVQGAQLDGDVLRLAMPKGTIGTFIAHEIIIETK